MNTRVADALKELGLFDDFEKTVENHPFHVELGESNTLNHTQRVVNAVVAEAGEDGFLPALLHDIGKLVTGVLKENGIYSYIGHDAAGAQMIRDLKDKCSYSGDELERAAVIAETHMKAPTVKKAGAISNIIDKLIMGDVDPAILRAVVHADMSNVPDIWWLQDDTFVKLAEAQGAQRINLINELKPR